MCPFICSTDNKVCNTLQVQVPLSETERERERQRERERERELPSPAWNNIFMNSLTSIKRVTITWGGLVKTLILKAN